MATKRKTTQSPSRRSRAKATPARRIRLSIRVARPRAMPRAMADLAPAALVPLDKAAADRERANAAIALAMADLLERRLNEPDEAKRRALKNEFDKLSDRQLELMAIELKELLDSEAVRDALDRLRNTTDALDEAAQEMKRATDAISQAAKVLGLVDGAIGILAELFV